MIPYRGFSLFPASSLFSLHRCRFYIGCLNFFRLFFLSPCDSRLCLMTRCQFSFSLLFRAVPYCIFRSNSHRLSSRLILSSLSLSMPDRLTIDLRCVAYFFPSLYVEWDLACVFIYPIQWCKTRRVGAHLSMIHWAKELFKSWLVCVCLLCVYIYYICIAVGLACLNSMDVCSICNANANFSAGSLHSSSLKDTPSGLPPLIYVTDDDCIIVASFREREAHKSQRSSLQLTVQLFGKHSQIYIIPPTVTYSLTLVTISQTHTFFLFYSWSLLLFLFTP